MVGVLVMVVVVLVDGSVMWVLVTVSFLVTVFFFTTFFAGNEVEIFLKIVCKNFGVSICSSVII